MATHTYRAGMRRGTAAQLTALAAALSRRSRVGWTVDGEPAGEAIHRLNGITPYIIHHAIRLAQAAGLGSLAPAVRFEHPSPGALFGLSMRYPHRGCWSASDQALLGVMYLHSLHDIREAVSVAAESNPDWRPYVRDEGDVRYVDARLVAAMSRQCYGERLGVDETPGQAPRAPASPVGGGLGL